MNDAVRLRARVLLRLRWRAVLAVGVVVGLCGGALVALATAARETARSLDTYVARIDSPDALAIICPAGATAHDLGFECTTHDPRPNCGACSGIPTW